MCTCVYVRMYVCICMHMCHMQTKYMDVITINRYYSWYKDPGRTDTIATQLTHDLEEWFKTRGKPMMLTEYGAGTVAGLHRVSVYVSVSRTCSRV